MNTDPSQTPTASPKPRQRARKLRGNSNWAGLTAEQQTLLDGWLFVERVAYEEIVRRARELWQIHSSTSSVGRYYLHRLKTRVLDGLGDFQEAAEAVDGSGAQLATLRTSALKLVAQRFFAAALDNGEVKDLALLSRVLADSEKRETQRKRLELARQRFQFNAAKAAYTQLPRVKEMEQEDFDREEERILAIKQDLFGKDLPE
jgi:hypothetical protein